MLVDILVIDGEQPRHCHVVPRCAGGVKAVIIHAIMVIARALRELVSVPVVAVGGNVRRERVAGRYSTVTV
jgi:hypothetical protein